MIAADAHGVGADEGPVDATKVDRLQSFVDLRLPIGDAGAVTVRGGRELMPLGSERLISMLDRSAHRRAPPADRASADAIRGGAVTRTMTGAQMSGSAAAASRQTRLRRG
ncbi:hypothetical protein [Hansschlegelia zhihuaiae]|uniref:Uncharacterized protein n=1 Tax=Hansschlegelia zhihuaiae TaxID=405005 RepID=A0A4Q0MK69_9HYPH|nr:hypothetical protein [Hansschlegelia zhihuaiae]RXF74141.1 hypothetical protein EK403_07155 [Hansschlegelia zhihuaiae]